MGWPPRFGPRHLQGISRREVAASGDRVGQSDAADLRGSALGRLQAVGLRARIGSLGPGRVSGNKTSFRQFGRDSDWVVLKMATIQIRTEIPGPRSRALLARRDAAIPRGPHNATPI